VFWSQHKPGDRWRCQCGLRQTDKETRHVTSPQTTIKDIPAAGLENNPADDGQLFSNNHPYYTETYPGAKKAVDNFLKTEIADTEVKAVKSFNNGGTFSQYASVDKNKSDYKLVKNIGLEFARMGKTATATPQLHYKSESYKQVYGSLSGTKYYRKSPDLLVNGKFYEVESYKPPFKKEKIGGMLGKGLKQSPNIIINNTKGVSDRFIKKIIYQRIRLGQDVNEVWLYEKGKIRLLYKKQ
jgi:hypothetical protein